MRKLLLFGVIMFICCEKENNNEVVTNDISEQYLGTWNFNKSYYESGINGNYFGNYNFTDVILGGELENELIIPISASPYPTSNIKLTVANDGTLSNFEQNFSKDYTIDSVSTYFICIDSIYLYYKLYTPNAMFVETLSGKKE